MTQFGRALKSRWTLAIGLTSGRDRDFGRRRFRVDLVAESAARVRFQLKRRGFSWKRGVLESETHGKHAVCWQSLEVGHEQIVVCIGRRYFVGVLNYSGLEFSNPESRK